MCIMTVNKDFCILFYQLLSLIIYFGIIITATIVFFIFRKPTSSLKVLVVQNYEECLQACKILEKDLASFPVLGMDAEWVSQAPKRNPVALLQLCTPQATCALFRLNCIPSIPNKLKLILENRNIVKAGIVPERDAAFLLQDYRIQVSSTLDLRFLYNTHKGLAKLAEEKLQIKLNKNLEIRCSNWETKYLTAEQIEYAAMDSYVAIELFKKVVSCHHLDDIQQYLDTPLNPKVKEIKKSKKQLVTNSKTYCLNKMAIKKKKIYDNCIMLSQEGMVLCSTRQSKAQWFLDKNKAELISEEPFTIRLKFKTIKNPSQLECRYESELKSDQCVACGAIENLTKHWIIPKMYRKHFPLAYKSHYSHDVLLLCVQCLLKCQVQDSHLMQQLERKAGVTGCNSFNVLRPSRIAKALQMQDIPVDRRRELEQELRTLLGVEQLSPQLVADIAGSRPQSNCGSGEAVVRFFAQEPHTIFQLIHLWRRHFVDTMKPEYLPKYWSIDYQN